MATRGRNPIPSATIPQAIDCLEVDCLKARAKKHEEYQVALEAWQEDPKHNKKPTTDFVCPHRANKATASKCPTSAFLYPRSIRIPEAGEIFDPKVHLHFHQGIDLAGVDGRTEIHAVMTGTVVDAVETYSRLSGYGSYGRVVVIQGDDKRFYLYAHCARLGVKKGDLVREGQTIAFVGRTSFDDAESAGHAQLGRNGLDPPHSRTVRATSASSTLERLTPSLHTVRHRLPALLAALVLLAPAACSKPKQKPPEAGPKPPAAATSKASAKGATADECRPGFEWQGSACADIDECGGVATPCGPHPDAKCRNTSGGYECTCPQGYVGGGPGGIGCAPAIVGLASHYCVLNDAGVASCLKPSSARKDMPKLLRGLQGIMAIEGWVRQGCMLLRDGTVRCWDDFSGVPNGAEPTTVPNVTGAVSISKRGQLACAVIRNGTVRCWGSNINGQLGRGTVSGREGAGAVFGIRDAVSVATGAFSACAVRRSGKVACWGRDSPYRIWDGQPENALVPQNLPGIDSALRVALDNHTCLLRADRKVACWGSNLQGNVGDGTTEERRQPTVLQNLDQVVWIAGGDEAMLAVRADGSLWRWGAVTGDPSRPVLAPTRIPELPPVRSASMEATSWSALVTDRELFYGETKLYQRLELSSTGGAK